MPRVTATYQDASGRPVPGRVTFHPPIDPQLGWWLPDPDGPAITGAATITHNGHLDANLTHPGEYLVTEYGPAGKPIRQRHITITGDTDIS